MTAGTTPPAPAATKARAQEYLSPPQLVLNKLSGTGVIGVGHRGIPLDHTVCVGVSVYWAPIADQGLQLISRLAESIGGRFGKFKLLLVDVGTETVVATIVDDNSKASLASPLPQKSIGVLDWLHTVPLLLVLNS